MTSEMKLGLGDFLLKTCINICSLISDMVKDNTFCTASQLQAANPIHIHYLYSIDNEGGMIPLQFYEGRN